MVRQLSRGPSYRGFLNWAEDKLEIDGKEIDGDEHFRFVRIGEEYEDIEVRGYAFDIHPVRGIEY